MGPGGAPLGPDPETASVGHDQVPVKGGTGPRGHTRSLSLGSPQIPCLLFHAENLGLPHQRNLERSL